METDIIKLIRTDNTLDLSQKAEKQWNQTLLFKIGSEFFLSSSTQSR